MRTRFVGEARREYIDTLKQIAALGDQEAFRVSAEALSKLLDTLMEALGYRRSNGQICAARLLGGRCTEYGRADGPKEHPHAPPGDDHPSLWLKDGKPHIYVSQPYGLEWDKLRALVMWCGRWGLRAAVHAESWHYPGRTVAVMITAAREDV